MTNPIKYKKGDRISEDIMEKWKAKITDLRSGQAQQLTPFFRMGGSHGFTPETAIAYCEQKIKEAKDA